MMNNRLIDNILYGNLRNPQHFNSRRKGFFKAFLKLLFQLITVKPKFTSERKPVLINTLSPEILNMQNTEWNERIIGKKMSFEDGLFRPLYVIDLLLMLSFLVNLKPFQKFIFSTNEKIFKRFMKKNEVVGLVCGPATILACFLAYYLKKEKKEIICIQHGIYPLESGYKVEWFEKDLMTRNFVWGQKYKEMFVDQGVDSKKIDITSPFFENKIDETKKIPLKQEKIKRVLFVGQPINKVSNQVKGPYNLFIENLINYFKKKGVKVTYKEHPRELSKENLTPSNYNGLEFFDNEADKIEDFDICYSVNSTLLIEIYLKKIKCFQADIIVPDYKYDDFQKYTGIPFLKTEDISGHLDRESYLFHVDSDYLNFWENYNQRMAKEVMSRMSDSKSEHHKFLSKI